LEGDKTEEGGDYPVNSGDLATGETSVKKEVMKVTAVSPNGRFAGTKPSSNGPDYVRKRDAEDKEEDADFSGGKD
jgi:hypothetical protein